MKLFGSTKTLTDIIKNGKNIPSLVEVVKVVLVQCISVNPVDNQDQEKSDV